MNTPEQWLQEQARLGRCLYLMLDSDGQMPERNALVAEWGDDRCRAVYLGTPAHSLASAGPYLFHIQRIDHPILMALLKAPETDWGWLASGSGTDLETLTQHWRDRLVTGEPSNQVLYRFHDNRVLGRALTCLPPEHFPGYLGPIASLCYWQVEQWQVSDNPDPGSHPLPSEPAWLNLATPQAIYNAVQFDNIRRYLMREHTEPLVALAEQQNIDVWLRTQLDLARTWDWREPEAIYFLLTQSLYAADYAPPESWRPKPSETPAQHFARLYQEALYWQGEQPL